MYSFWDGVIIFGMALTISDGEMRLVKKIAEHAYATLILSNDYFSWQKEYNDFCRHRSSGSMANAIWVIMNEYSVDVDEAKSMCIEKIKASCQTFCEKKKQLSAKFYLKLSEDLFKYLRALETLITGHAVWSQHTKRYKKKANGKAGSARITAPSPTSRVYTPEMDDDTEW